MSAAVRVRAVIGPSWNRAADSVIDREVERLLGESPWRPSHVWDMDGVLVSERTFQQAWAHFEATGERPTWWLP